MSTELFAKHLTSTGQCEVVIACPRLDTSPKEEIKDGYKILRYSFPVHIVRHKPLSQFFHNSLFLSLWRAIFIIKIIKKEKIDILHVQEKYLLISGVLAKMFTGKKLIITIRDYQLLCPLGFCIKKERGYKTCSLREFFQNDIPYYFNNYLLRSDNSRVVTTIKIIFSVTFLLRARFVAWLYRISLKFCDEIVFISNKQKKIYEINGIKKGRVIYNIADFEKSNINTEKDIDILFVGKPSVGKGIKLLSDVQKEVENRNLNYKIEIAGGNKFVAPHDLPELYRRTRLTIVPSHWEEPFGRVALESLSYGTPVLTTNKGGLPEIVENDLTGIISKENIEDMLRNIKYILNNEEKFKRGIEDRYQKLKQKFLGQPIDEYLNLYKMCLNRK